MSLTRSANAPWSTIEALKVQALALDQLDRPEGVAELTETMIETFDDLRGSFVTDVQRTSFEGLVSSLLDLQDGGPSRARRLDPSARNR